MSINEFTLEIKYILCDFNGDDGCGDGGGDDVGIDQDPI